MITLTRKQLEKVNVLAALTNGLLTNRQAAQTLHLSVRTIQRKKKAYLTEKEQAIIHKNTGRRPSNRIPNEIRTQIAHLLTTDLQGYNFAHASEILQTESALSCSESTVCRVANEFRLSAPGKKRRSARHPSRKRRPCEGEMAQADASQYDWLSTGKNSYLHGYIDDATGKILALSLCEQETFEGYRQGLLAMNAQHHLPQSLYTDGRNVFVLPEKDRIPGDEELLAGITDRETDFVRGMKELGMIHIHAHTPQAKGRIERLWRTLQNRLPHDFRRLGIHTIPEANAYLPQYIESYNAKFSVPAQDPTLKYLPSVSAQAIRFALSHHDFRKLQHGCEIVFHKTRYVLTQKDIKKVPAQTSSVEVVHYADFGVRVLIPGTEQYLTPEIIQPKISIPKKAKHTKEELQRIRRENGRKGKAASPWRFGYK